MSKYNVLFSKIFISILSLNYFITPAFCQSKNTYKTTINKANSVVIYNNIDNSNKNKILLVDRFINPKIPLIIRAGITMHTSVKNLISKRQKVFVGPGVEDIINFKIINKKLSINSTVRSSDQKVLALVRDNKLVSSKGLYQKITDQYFQVIDDFGVPVLQIILNKMDNSITVNGVFFYDSYCYILNDGNMLVLNFPKSLLEMNANEFKVHQQKILNEARTIKEL